MEDEPRVNIGVAYPVAEHDRRKIRGFLATRGIPAPHLPIVFVAHSVLRLCVKCGMTLSVGPKLLAKQCPVYCPVCGLIEMGKAASRAEDVQFIQLRRDDQ